ncbi:MAG: permease-like cell division protein FtsX [Clostridia bacterium]|nr:permease-like cell division protein FtsX [Clostridia bacterium]
MERIRYFFGEALRSIWKNRMMSMASIGVLAVCLILLGSSLIVSYNISNVIRQIEGQNQIMVFLNDDLDTAGIENVGDEITALPDVKECIFVSKQEALDEQKKALGSNADLLSGYDADNFLPNGYRISLTGMEHFSQTVQSLEKIPGIIKIQQHEDVADKLNNIKRIISMVGIWLFVILALVSLFIISNTIKLAMFVRKREINIMKFVGATDWFIRWPFVFEGMLIGLIASLLAFGVQYYIYRIPLARVMTDLKLQELTLGSTNIALLLAAFVCAGIIVGVCGSLISVRKYLKV